MDPIVAALVAGIAAGLTALWRAFIKGDLVPGSIYRAQVALTEAERQRADKADTQVERNTEALNGVTSTVKLSLEQRQSPSSDGSDA